MSDEYPKIIEEREQSTMVSCWTEYLQLRRHDHGSAVIAICQYEALAHVSKFEDEEGNLTLPSQIDGKSFGSLVQEAP
jgi:hypothetical protein